MDIIELLLRFTLLGTEWVFYLLIGLSLLSLTVMIERGIFFRQRGRGREELLRAVEAFSRDRERERLRERLQGMRNIEAAIILRGLDIANPGGGDSLAAISGILLLERKRMERGLPFLGTVGNNAVFIGLFGTVLGIIRAFHDLSLDQGGGARAVMQGISEALVATALGLFVAIPAVIAYNYFTVRVRTISQSVKGLAEIISSEGEKG